MGRLLLPVVLALAVPSNGGAERLPIRAYTTADGLAHNTVNRIVRDSRGFLWFATDDGLSRFDGYAFRNYSVEQGLPHRKVTDLLETHAGELWVATFGGLVRFRPDGLANGSVEGTGGGPSLPMFETLTPPGTDPRAREVMVLLEGRDGAVWCGTRAGLFRVDRAGSQFELRHIPLPMPDDDPEQRFVKAVVEDEHGSLWAATPSGLYRRWRDGSTARYEVPVLFGRQQQPGLNRDHGHLHDLMNDRQGRLWAASRAWGIFRLVADETPRPPEIVEHHGYPDPFASWVVQMRETSDGGFWITTNLGLVELERTEEGASRLVAYNRSHGLIQEAVTALAEDAGGNLWIGSGAGAMKLTRDGFLTYGRSDGIAGGMQVFEDGTGRLHAVAHVFRSGLPWGFPSTDPRDEYVEQQFGRFDGRSFEWFAPARPFGFGWVPAGSVLRTRDGEWWLAASTGLFRYAAYPEFRALTSARPIRIFTKKDGLIDTQVYRMLEDSRGDVWFSIISFVPGLYRWNRASDTISDFSSADGLPAMRGELPRAFGEDAAGGVWIGFNGGVARFRDGRFVFYTTADDLPAGSIDRIHTAGDGRLWLGSSHSGLIRVDDPSGRPSFTSITTAQGLSGDRIEGITEDLQGRLYVATGRGVDRIDPASGRIRHFTTGDGLAPGWVAAAYRDRSGALWFGTNTALSRFVPPPPRQATAPPILIMALTLGGDPRPVSAIGETSIALPDLGPGGDQLQIEFASLRFATGKHIRYQYRLDGADTDWWPPTDRRSVTYARLRPGRYRFLVRAVNADGLTSLEPAVVSFTVLPPIWLRGWFLTAMALGVAAAALALHRYRLARTLELERVRTRIATDLHDDVGANLTRIAILSEVARRQPRAGAADLDAPLSSIADIARESVATMSDIVWAISPERDTLHDMVRRMREHAEELFESRNIRVLFDMPDPAPPARLGVDLRRDLYLIFKEAVNNAARHSGCRSVAIALRSDGSTLSLEVTDDGVGFEPHQAQEGNGLASMRRRADRMTASLDVLSAPGAGTTVRVTLPGPGTAPPTWKGR